MSSEEPGKTAADLMGIRRKGPIAAAPTPAGVPALTENAAPTTAWEIYNNRAAIFDKELIKDWNDSLNTLLVFAALYSGVLTAFIIESMKLMQQDPTEMTRDILLTITKQLANQSTPAFEPPTFQVPSYATLVNACFFISIIFSLVAALGAVLGLQWVGNYDFGLNSSSPKERALQRQFRYMGIEDWKMAEIIAFLPIFLFASLFLFLIGLAVWLFQIHKVISAFVILGVTTAAIFYIATTIIAIRHVDAPFRTPVSKSLPVIYYTSIKFIKSLPRFLFQSNQSPHEDEYSFMKCEAKAIRIRPFVEMDGLLWAVKSLDTLPHSRDALKVLLETFMKLPMEKLFNSKVNDAPWLPIFKMLCQPYFHKKRRDDYSDEDQRSGELLFILKAMAMIGDDGFDGEEFHEIKDFLSSLSTLPSWYFIDNTLQTYANLILCRRGHQYRIEHILSYIRSLFRRPHIEALRFLTIIHNLQLNKPGVFDKTPTPSLHATIAPGMDITLEEITTNPPLPHEILNILLHIFVTEITGPSTSSTHNPLEVYLSAYNNGQPIRSIMLGDSYYITHRAIRRHYIAHLTQIRGDPGPSSSELMKVLTPVHDIILWTSGETRIETLRDILSTFLDSSFRTKLGDLRSTYTLIKVVSLAFCVPATAGFNLLTFDNESKEDWFMEMSMGCDARLNENSYGPSDRLSFLRLYCKTLDKINRRMISVKKEDQWVKSIRSPYIALLVWTVLDFNFEHPALTSFPPEIWIDPVWEELVQWSFTYTNFLYFKLSLSPGFVPFARAALTYGSQDTKKNCVQRLGFTAKLTLNDAAYNDHQPVQVDIYDLFQAPGLQNMLNLPSNVIERDLLVTILCWISEAPWFNEQFIKANGFDWLKSAIESLKRCHWCIRMILNAAPRCRSFSELAQWMDCLKECLVRTPPRENEYQHEQMEILRSILAEQLEQRSRNSTALPELGRYDYVRTWTDPEWDHWRTYVENLVERLRGTYIFEQQQHFAMDPDGVCCLKSRRDLGEPNQEGHGVENGNLSVDFRS